LRLSTIYRGIAKCTIANGSTTCFWEDLWSDAVLSSQFPQLFSFARNETISVQGVIHAEDLDSLFILPLSTQGHDELQILQHQLSDIQYDEDSTNIWEPLWGPTYSSHKFYAYVFRAMDTHLIYKLVWKSCCTPHVKIFAWLILVDRLNTKVMLRRRHLNTQDDHFCVMCSANIEEDIEHLFFSCPFAQQCWSIINFSWDLALPL
jgi:hypothetical protein